MTEPTVAEAVPLFVMVTTVGAVVVPTSTFPKLTVTGLSVMFACVPTPVTLEVCVASPVTVTTAASVPVTRGLNTTFAVHVAAGANVEGERGQLSVTLYEVLFTVTLVMFNASVPVLV